MVGRRKSFVDSFIARLSRSLCYLTQNISFWRVFLCVIRHQFLLNCSLTTEWRTKVHGRWHKKENDEQLKEAKCRETFNVIFGHRRILALCVLSYLDIISYISIRISEIPLAMKCQGAFVLAGIFFWKPSFSSGVMVLCYSCGSVPSNEMKCLIYWY